jgi:hypothetical protein
MTFNFSKHLRKWIECIWVILIQQYLYHLEKTSTLISIKVHQCSVQLPITWNDGWMVNASACHHGCEGFNSFLFMP